MTYENLKFSNAHMAIHDGYFYMVDSVKNVLVQKTGGGQIAFQYPIDIPITFTAYSNIGNILCIQSDGYGFWTLQKFTDNTGLLFRYWVIEGALCSLKKQYTKLNNTYYIYDAATFSVEHYLTTTSGLADTGTNVLNITEYSDSAIYIGTVISLGPNKYGQKEIISVGAVSGINIYTTTNFNYPHFDGEPVSIAPSLLLFNNYSGRDATKGSLIIIDPNTGAHISAIEDIEYLNITASKFTRLQGVLLNDQDVSTLAYVKGTNTKFRNINDTQRYRATVKGFDSFDGIDYSVPDNTIWDVTLGDPVIFNNQLYCSTVGNGADQIKSKYYLLSDFDVQVSGTFGSYTTFSGTSQVQFLHYIGLTVPRTGKDFKFGLNYLHNPVYTVFYDDLSKGGGNWVTANGTVTYTNNMISVLNNGADCRTTDINTVTSSGWDTTFKIRHFGTLTSSTQLLVYAMYNNSSDNIGIIFTVASTYSYIQVYSTYGNYGSVFYTSNKYSYHTTLGTWYRVRLKYTSTMSYFRVWLDGTAEPSTWDWSGNTIPPPPNSAVFRVNITGYPTVSGASVSEITINSSTLDYAPAVDNISMCSTVNDYIKNYSLLGPPSFLDSSKGYVLNLSRVGDTLKSRYILTISGVYSGSWVNMPDQTIYSYSAYLTLGLTSTLVTVSGSYFNDLTFNIESYLRYPATGESFYGVMGMDNLHTNLTTIIPIYAIDIIGEDLYRLQYNATYYGTYYYWNTYNYQVSPIRPFIDFITVDSDTHILPATGRNNAIIKAVVLDQYGQGVINKPVEFADDDPIGFITRTKVYTDVYNGTGAASTVYKSGTALRVVTITSTSNQYD